MLDYKKKVKIPSKTYEKKQGKNVYLYYTVESIYDPKTKNTKNNRINIGKKILDDPEYMHPNANYYLYFSDDYIEELDSDYGFSLNIGAHLIIDKILEEIHLKDILSSVFKDKAPLMASLIGYYISMGTTVNQHFSHYAFSNITYLKKIPSNGTISNLFNKYITYEMIHNFLTQWVYNIKNIIDLDGALLTLDSTNFNTYSQSVSLAEYGRPKEDEGLPQINLFYSLEHKTGIPIFYDLYPGSIIDQTHLEMAIKQSTTHNLKNLTFIMDRGYFSQKNIKFLHDNGFEYIFMAGSHYVTMKEIFNKYSKKLRNGAKYYLPFYNVFGIRIETNIFKTSEEKGYVYMFYSREKESIEISSYERRVDKFLKDLKNIKVLSTGILDTYKNYIDFETDDKNNIHKISINREKHQETMDGAGYYFMASSKKYELEEIIEIYKKRDIVEKMFKLIKNELDSSKLYANSNEALESKVLLVFIASIVRSVIANKAHEYLKENSSETVNTLINTLNRIQVIKKNGAYKKTYALTRKQKEILKYFNLDNNNIDELIIKINQSIL